MGSLVFFSKPVPTIHGVFAPEVTVEFFYTAMASHNLGTTLYYSLFGAPRPIKGWAVQNIVALVVLSNRNRKKPELFQAYFHHYSLFGAPRPIKGWAVQNIVALVVLSNRNRIKKTKLFQAYFHHFISIQMPLPCSNQ